MEGLGSRGPQPWGGHSSRESLEKVSELIEQNTKMERRLTDRPDAPQRQFLAPCTSYADFDLGPILGTGTYGLVHLAVHKASSRPVAIKSVSKAKTIEGHQVPHILAERNILAAISSPFVVNLIGTFQDENMVMMVMEYVPGGELFTLLQANKKFPEPAARFYAAEVVVALSYLHERDIAYRDLKPENVLIDATGHICLTDFGFAKVVPDDWRTFTLCGTPDYSAPEVILNKGHGKAVDWWALGVLLYEMIAGIPPFYDEDLRQCYKKILAGEIDFSCATFSDDAKDIISGLLQQDLSRRLGNQHRGVRAIMEHPFFRGISWENLSARQYRPPHIPRLKSRTDTTCFEDYSAQDVSRHFVPKFRLSPQEQELFKNF